MPLPGPIITRAGQNFMDHLARAYNLTIDNYQQLVDEQEGRCAVCDSLPKPGRRLHIDHDHHTGETRGLLCGACNTALGLMEERVDLINRLGDYAHRAARLREEVRQRPRSVLGVPRRHRRHPLTRLFERVPDKTACAQSIVAAVDCWRLDPPQRSLPLPTGVEEYWPTASLSEEVGVGRG